MFDVIGKRNWFFLFSGLVLVPGLIFIFLTPITNGQTGLQFSIDYTGGTVWEVQFKNTNVTTDQVTAEFVKYGVADVAVSQDSAKFFTIQTKDDKILPQPTRVPATLTPTVAPSSSAAATTAASSSPASSASASPAASAAASASPAASPSASSTPAPVLTGVGQDGQSCQLLIPTTGKIATIAAAMQADPKFGPIACTRETSTVGPLISGELITQTIELILFGSLGILAWVGFRFGSIKFGATALVALLHDVIVVVGIFAILGALFKVRIDGLFVPAMLTVIGFSVHDTIVVFDRIRENRTRHAGEPFDRIGGPHVPTSSANDTRCVPLANVSAPNRVPPPGPVQPSGPGFPVGCRFVSASNWRVAAGFNRAEATSRPGTTWLPSIHRLSYSQTRRFTASIGTNRLASPTTPPFNLAGVVAASPAGQGPREATR